MARSVERKAREKAKKTSRWESKPERALETVIDAYVPSMPLSRLAALSLLRGRERRSWDRDKQPPEFQAVSRSHSRSKKL